MKQITQFFLHGGSPTLSPALTLFLEVYLFCCSVFDYGTFKYAGRDEKKNIIVLVFSHIF